MMKKRLILCLAVMLALTLGLFVSARATEDNLKVSMELSETTLTEPKEVTVTIQVTNSGETDMPGPVTLYYPNGKQVEEFGSPTLAVGTSKTWSGTWEVTQSQLEAGKLTFKLKYSLINDAGEMVNKTVNFYRELNYTGAVASVEINRTITPTTAREGQEVSITYDVVNTGNVDVTDVSIKENSSISSAKGTIATVPAGEKASYTFTTTMKKKDLTSSATITYKAGGKTFTEKKEEASIKYGEVKLTASLSADKKGGTPGESVKLTLTLKNSGNVDYTNVAVTDAVLGEVFTGLTVPAGKTVTQEKEIIIDETADYQFTVTGADASGATVETATDRLSVQALDPAQKITLTVEAEADRTTVYTLPGTVKFVVKVTNNSTVEVKDVTVSASGVQLYSFPSIDIFRFRQIITDGKAASSFMHQAFVSPGSHEGDLPPGERSDLLIPGRAVGKTVSDIQDFHRLTHGCFRHLQYGVLFINRLQTTVINRKRQRMFSDLIFAAIHLIFPFQIFPDIAHPVKGIFIRHSGKGDLRIVQLQSSSFGNIQPVRKIYLKVIRCSVLQLLNPLFLLIQLLSELCNFLFHPALLLRSRFRAINGYSKCRRCCRCHKSCCHSVSDFFLHDPVPVPQLRSAQTVSRSIYFTI